MELFTLCDLLQIRLDNPYARSKNGKDELYSFFYNKKFNQPKDDMAVNVLSFVVSVIECYLEQYGNTDDNLLLNKYLAMQLRRFRDAKKKLYDGPLVAQQDAHVPGELLERLCLLGTQKRIGWAIPDVISGIISESEFSKIRDAQPIHETTLQHTYEAFLIGLLYLPSKSRTNEQYDKQKILNILLVHDLGETWVGDIVPAYEHYNRSREEERVFCEELYLQGTRSGIADLSDYLFLWEAWCNSSRDDYNIRIAKEIDKIQMLYKMLLLLNTQTVELTRKRIGDFWKSKNAIKTIEGKEIFNLLIVRDTKIKAIAERYGLSISELK